VAEIVVSDLVGSLVPSAGTNFSQICAGKRKFRISRSLLRAACRQNSTPARNEYTPFCDGPGDVKSPRVIVTAPSSSEFCNEKRKLVSFPAIRRCDKIGVLVVGPHKRGIIRYRRACGGNE